MSGEVWHPFPSIHPEETLFSWIVAYGRLAAISEPREISRRLCGHPNAILRHDFPCRLDDLCQRLESHLGSAQDLIGNHTLLPFFAPFLTAQTYYAAVDAMRTGGTLHLRGLLGLSPSRMGMDAPLKACPDCIAGDLWKYRRALWYRDHQWPTAFLCPRHATTLRIASPEYHAQRQLPLLAPNDLPPDAWLPPGDVVGDSSTKHCLDELDSWTRNFAAQQPNTYYGKLLREVYALGAQRRGWLALDGSIRLLALRDAFVAHYRDAMDLPGLGFVAQTGGPNGGFINQLLRQYDGLHHPARHITLAAFLFNDFEAFEDAHRVTTERLSCQNNDIASPRTEPLKEALERIQSGESVNAVAQSIGAPTTQLIHHATKAGIPYRKRPHIVGTETENKLVTMLRRGASRAAIVRRLAIRPGFIKDYLAARPDLLRHWESRHFERQRKAYRLQFQRTLDRNPGVPMKRVRRIPGNGFQWLYNNDRDWLQAQLPTLWTRSING